MSSVVTFLGHEASSPWTIVGGIIALVITLLGVLFNEHSEKKKE
jgi:hypothetical protein